ncbi:putative histone H2B [Gregarina niphandrodes]|uniref:Histone H2B n=1 Tax=Gregarina niphandrodes TaxID=110365 RepID=A0A023BDT5_GRENI|nr:putative histone H2B [Gregarina niphandrodes]EZG89222.1 putative histone H2B [Gregarina niphandrodes]|eukprot:XP_011128493.1 putative histone H2B [Gregarina niphandrodes]
MQTSVRLLLPGELSKHAATEGAKAVENTAGESLFDPCSICADRDP